ncbi:MAG: hypothetical protein HXS46_20785 [Theionarchaea archaeon]|nr:hypothetical protein [Theionarchaea archaeon]
MDNLEKLIERVVSDAEFREKFLKNPGEILEKYEIEIPQEELEKIKALGDTESEKLAEELSKRLSKSCSWQT